MVVHFGDLHYLLQQLAECFTRSYPMCAVETLRLYIMAQSCRPALLLCHISAQSCSIGANLVIRFRICFAASYVDTHLGNNLSRKLLVIVELVRGLGL